MLQLVNVGHKSLADYATIATRGMMDEIRRLAEPLAGKRVVHLSATAFGGGVAEINYTLVPKNMALSAEDAAYIVDQFGIDVERPLLTQVSRFDPWKDPLGVIDAYRVVKERFPNVQLALVGSMAHDDPEGWDFYNQTVAY